MNSYTFYTINTVIDIGDGNTPPINDGIFTGAMNLCRLVESVMIFDRPMMVSVVRTEVDLSKNNNAAFYNLPSAWGECIVSTFKFALPMDVNVNCNGIPLVLPTEVNGTRLTKFNSVTSERNISISKQTFSRT
ncbi:hypothetical protein pEaSNUABM50_00288 [Erwinia phage pEa_SNUABM_50]|uniref:Uncharacterized protein n=4 Tax=Eneladusvirus BF TaxID=2560751 RepID=A0A7L8ZMU0_9CAUD|nr:virion structural protein [Serratia phage BF]QOI71229.1 hypothetical protein pEaSNUABM12_00291 [Erwinia phage pEa_SNUABM_12]QOI71773.1 hypothetical protein pEaSNUABM47_00289 [Erwinia phage pEa_SNUABM_47]QOI72312.1 hypothetical protein pEaSNUABM50_00288 [Erwinia phage pEa_SNUABM_50]QXO11438.1 hypothetical protein pEaSNUABM19_00292 [Erwinia phage pEa_SNUABM_19]QXO11986.1 hypothetical protein pEaSNUABM44_00290 [Erwinia phage pEa_SNUABM_44]QXO12539.1 hypothetical protein pEaSNUABM49_00293 [Erw